MKMKLFLVTLFFGLIDFLPAIACNLSPESSWFWSEERLIEKTQLILKVKITAESNGSKSGYSTYKASLKQVIKSLSGMRIASEIDLKDFAPSVTEWNLNRNKGRTTYSKDCQPWTNFQINREYLIFLNYDSSVFLKVLHPKAYEEVNGPSDSWYLRLMAAAKKTT